MSDSGRRWRPLDIEGVREVATQAARRVHYRNGAHLELEDVTQEAFIALVTIPDLVALLKEEDVELGLIQYRLEQALVRRFRTEVSQRERESAYEHFDDNDENVVTAFEYVPLPPIAADYNRETVELLLPAVWDASLSYGLENERSPDPDMPRGSTNKATGNNLPAFIADIKTGWEKSPLSKEERRSIIMYYGLGWNQASIGTHEGVSQKTISNRLVSGVGKIVSRLNGGVYYELLGAAA